jgi:hypothetical protein
MSLLDEIRACPAPMLESRDTAAIAAHLSEGRMRLRAQPTHIGKGTILATLGLDAQGQLAGNLFLDAIDGQPQFRHIKEVIGRGDFDLADPLAQAMVQALVGVLLTQAQADALCALGFEPDPLTELQVRLACYDATGKEWLP